MVHISINIIHITFNLGVHPSNLIQYLLAIFPLISLAKKIRRK